MNQYVQRLPRPSGDGRRAVWDDDSAEDSQHRRRTMESTRSSLSMDMLRSSHGYAPSVASTSARLHPGSERSTSRSSDSFACHAPADAYADGLQVYGTEIAHLQVDAARPRDMQHLKSMEGVQQWLDHICWSSAGCLDHMFIFDQSVVRHTGSHVVVMATGSFEKLFAIKCFVDSNSFQMECQCYRVLMQGCPKHAAPFVHAFHSNAGKGIGTLTMRSASYIVMTRGVPLCEFIQRQDPHRDVALLILRDVSKQLAALHEAGLAHRGVSPRNVLWLPDRRSWQLIDFAGAGRIGTRAPVRGALHYCAPEAAAALNTKVSVAVSGASDVWALGVMSLELLTGQLLFGARTSQDKMLAMLLRQGSDMLPFEQDWHVLRRVGGLKRLVKSMLARDVAVRPTMQQVHEHLCRAAADVQDRFGTAYAS